MWEEILRLAMGNGIWAVLFCVVFFYQLKDSKKRETKYQDVISELSKNLGCVFDIKEKLEDTLANAEKIADKNEGLLKIIKSKRKRETQDIKEQCVLDYE